MKITLVLPANIIAEGSTVRKLTGSVEYKLVRKIEIHTSGDKSKKQEIKSHGVVYLIDPTSGSISAFDESNHVFALDMSISEAIHLLDEINSED